MTKPTLILLPGYDGNGPRTFQEFVDKLKGRYRTLTITYPFYNQSNKIWSIDDLISAIHATVKNNKLSNYSLVGFSMGGMVAAAYAQKYQEEVRGVILISSSTKPILSKLLTFTLMLFGPLFDFRFMGEAFTRVYCSKWMAPYLKSSPLPVLRTDFPPELGWVVFGTLSRVLRSSLRLPIISQSVNKLAVLFADDNSFPPEMYGAFLRKSGFNVVVHKTGGHGEGEGYWDQVINDLKNIK